MEVEVTTGHPAGTGRWDEKTTLAGLIGKKTTPAKKPPTTDKEAAPSDKSDKS